MIDLLESHITYQDEDNDGNWDRITTTSFEYDIQQKLISENEKQITEVYKGNIESYEKNLKLIYIVEKVPKIILEVLSIILIIFITIILFKNFEIQII